jgi:hypothetical protein
MQDVNVLVVFYSRYGSTERLALAAAVGAVQGRANIRLRRLEDSGEASVDWQEQRDRMNKEYVAPRDRDAEWADAILFGLPGNAEALTPEVERYFQSLGAGSGQRKLAGKIAAPFVAAAWVPAVCAALSGSGFEVMAAEAPLEADVLTAARMQGRRIAEAARTRRANSRQTQV